MKIAVLGANGMLGARVVEEFNEAGHDVIPFTRKDLDLRRACDMYVMVRLAQPKFDWIINCAGVVKSESEKDPIQTVLVNSALPHLLAESTGSMVLHVSTDCVFDGEKGNYEIHDAPKPVDLYGATKLAGEVIADNAFTVRTSFIGWENGTERGLLEWFVRQKHVSGYTKCMWSGLSAREVARALIHVVNNPPEVKRRLFHLAGDQISKYDLLCLLADKLKLDIAVDPVEEPRIDRTMNGWDFEVLFKYDRRSWEQMAEELARERPA